MLLNVTLSNKTTEDPNVIEAPLEDIELLDGTKYTPTDYRNVSSSNPIIFGKLNARDNPVLTKNTLVINIDDKDYIASEFSAIFNPGRAPVKFNVKDLVELDSVVKDSLYDVVSNDADDNTLEIQGGHNDFSKYINLYFCKDKTEEELKQMELEYKQKNKDYGIQGFDIGPIKVNNTGICFSSLELFTDSNLLKARGVFAISSIKFSGENVTTEATYYKEKEDKLIKYVFKPSSSLTTNYSDLVFYIDSNTETQESINKKLEEAVSNNWVLYSINDLLIDS